MNLKNINRWLVLAMAPLLLALFAGCERSTVDKVEDNVANSVDAVGDALDDARDEVQDAARDLKNKVD